MTDDTVGALASAIAKHLATPEHPQLNRDDLKRLTPDQIVAADERGQLRDLRTPQPEQAEPTREGQLDRTRLSFMTPQEIRAADDAGQLEQIQGRNDKETTQ